MVFVPISPELSSAFGTPMSIRTVEGADRLNAGLERAILARAQRGEANRISNIGGWQSLPDILDWPEPEIKLLAQEVDRSVQQISALPAVLQRGGPMHWSVVYYVVPGTPNPDTPMNGRIELRDPRPAATFARIPGFTSGQPMLIRPQAGMMLVFPSWIEHCVHPFYGDGHRISIAINVAVETT
jgi:hypothetical protein